MVRRNSRVPRRGTTPARKIRLGVALNASGRMVDRATALVQAGPLVLNDFVLLSFAIWAAYTLRLSRLYVPGSTEMAAADGGGSGDRRR